VRDSESALVAILEMMLQLRWLQLLLLLIYVIVLRALVCR
jgi:hypothetical protein